VFVVGEGVHAGEEIEYVAADVAHAPARPQLGELGTRAGQQLDHIAPNLTSSSALVLRWLLRMEAPQEGGMVVEAQAHVVHRLCLPTRVCCDETLARHAHGTEAHAPECRWKR
jgi:hypothetical protein